MSHFLYILYSLKIDKYYVGESADPEFRKILHNQHHFKKNYTKAADDWIIALSFECTNRQDAVYLERFIKRMKSKVFIRKIIAGPNILKEILKKME